MQNTGIGLGLGLFVSSLTLVGGVPEATLAQPAIAQQTAKPINTNQVRKILDAILIAAQKRDTQAVVQYLAPQAVVDMAVQSIAGAQRLRLNREQYQQYLQQGFELAQDYSSTLSNVEVTVGPDGKTAIATYSLTETMNLKEPAITVTSSTTSQVRFEQLNNQVLATEIKSNSIIEAKAIEVKPVEANPSNNQAPAPTPTAPKSPTAQPK